MKATLLFSDGSVVISQGVLW